MPPHSSPPAPARAATALPVQRGLRRAQAPAAGGLQRRRPGVAAMADGSGESCGGGGEREGAGGPLTVAVGRNFAQKLRRHPAGGRSLTVASAEVVRPLRRHLSHVAVTWLARRRPLVGSQAALPVPLLLSICPVAAGQGYTTVALG